MLIRLLENGVVKLSLVRNMSFYAVARGHQVGIFDTWSQCESQVKGFKGAKYKKFPTRREAESFIKSFIDADHCGRDNKPKFSPKETAIPLGWKKTDKSNGSEIKSKLFDSTQVNDESRGSVSTSPVCATSAPILLGCKIPMKSTSETFVGGVTSESSSSQKTQLCSKNVVIPLGWKTPVMCNERASKSATIVVGDNASSTGNSIKKDIVTPKGVEIGVDTNRPFDYNETEPLSKKMKLDKESTGPKDFWPVDHEDTFDCLIDHDYGMLSAIAKIEGNKETVPSTSAAAKGQKNKAFAKKSAIPEQNIKIWEPDDVRKIGGYEFNMDKDGFVIAYTDGSCLSNGQKDACAGFGVYFEDDHPLNAAMPVVGRVTNNTGEIQAAIYAIKLAKDVGIMRLCIRTDSQFLINATTSWIADWKRRDWHLKTGKPVRNLDDFKELDKLLQDHHIQVKWNYVQAHKGIKGNEMADKLAREGADIYKRAHSLR